MIWCPCPKRLGPRAVLKMFILVGTEVRLKDLVKGITVMSGNDTCVAVAEHVAGNVTLVVCGHVAMNAKARKLGLYRDPFNRPSRLIR